jgi:site-specific recombinase XerD
MLGDGAKDARRRLVLCAAARRIRMGIDSLRKHADRPVRELQMFGSMSQLPFDDVPSRIEQILGKLEGAYSPRTITAYRADFMRFSQWCAKRRLVAFPAKPKTIAIYVSHCSKDLKITTLRRMVACIRRLHQLASLVDPTSHVDVHLAMRRIARRQFERPRQAMGITLEIREELMRVCTDDLRGLRDRALLAVGFETLGRASELVGLNVEHLRANPRKTGSILIARGKTDISGFGRLVVLSRGTTDILREWLTAADLQRGPIFRPIYNGHVVSRRMTSHCVGRILKARARQAGMDSECIQAISGHSLRVGGAQQLTLNGHGLPQVMRAGGWRSVTTVARYIENAEMTLWD